MTEEEQRLQAEELALAEKKGKCEDDEVIEEDEEDNEDDGKDKKKEKPDFKEDLDALVNSEATLSEGFRSKAATIFESAVNSRVAEKVDSLDEEYADKLAEEVTSIEEELVEKVDSYLSYVVDEWLKENALQVEQGIRTEQAEAFLTSLHTMFKENYVEVPESKVDLVDELADKVDGLEESLNKETTSNIALTTEIAALRKEKAVNEASFDLSESQKEKLVSLTKDMVCEDVEEFTSKVDELKEAYFAEKPQTLVKEELEIKDSEKEMSEQMKAYTQALSK
jgi:hypothetical protein